MTDIEPKEVFRQIGLDMINEYRVQKCVKPIDYLAIDTPEVMAFIRSIQLHEKTKKELQGVKQELADYKQKVSDEVEKQAQTVWDIHCRCGTRHPISFNTLSQFIIPAPKPDPLVAALEGVTFDHYPPNDAKTIRAALDKLGFEIREKNDDN